MWFLLVILLLLLLISWEVSRQLPSCEGWDNLFHCLDLNHNNIHWTRTAIISIIAALVLLFLLQTFSFLSFLLIFLVVFTASYFSFNWLDAHLRREPDYRLEFYLEKLRQRS